MSYYQKLWRQRQRRMVQEQREEMRKARVRKQRESKGVVDEGDQG